MFCRAFRIDAHDAKARMLPSPLGILRLSHLDSTSRDRENLFIRGSLALPGTPAIAPTLGPCASATQRSPLA